ncbi:hypothetical protein [Planobispora longispora]|uniref:Secreted protein n=1 Tax=Planobispora longispora TaxID=28887 RepID=A0A8J3RNK6_9ACTN|nr:hypothetical protein [Planobispora longispora]BFE78674.1 hypothetical protein GCM10020093_012750 [Planobispora longispora]GIH79916.1 hypothetical protein Plo01_63450 [Planobispora longispora]
MDTTTWPGTVLILGLSLLALFLLIGTAATVLEFRKLKMSAAVQEELRQLVRRYEQLAENTLDAQRRTANDVSELRSRAASIEQILRSVE